MAALARQVAALVQTAVAADVYLNDPNRQLHIRRSKLRERLHATEQMQELEVLCAAILGTTAFGGGSDEAEIEHQIDE